MRYRKENKLLIYMSGISVAIALAAILYAANWYDNRPIDDITQSEPTEATYQPTETMRLEETEPETIPIYYYYNEEEIEMLAQLLWSECRGVPSTTRKACVAWVVCNRVDAGEYDSIYDAITAPGQFEWYSYDPVTTELYWIAHDVLCRWNMEKNGMEDVGRVIPQDYQWFHGENGENYFRNEYSGDFDTWDYSMPSPYDD